MVLGVRDNKKLNLASECTDSTVELSKHHNKKWKLMDIIPKGW